jgi:hypothetical protein
MNRGVEGKNSDWQWERNWGGVRKKKKEEKRENTMIKVTTEEI